MYNGQVYCGQLVDDGFMMDSVLRGVTCGQLSQEIVRISGGLATLTMCVLHPTL